MINGRVVDPRQPLDAAAPLAVQNRPSEGFSTQADELRAVARTRTVARAPVVPVVPVVDTTGVIACQQLIDLRVHQREPGFGQKEDAQTGWLFAAHGLPLRWRRASR